MVDVRKAPFYLDEDGERWVKETLSGMSVGEKAGQLFCVMGYSSDDKTLGHYIDDLHIGGMMYRPALKAEIQETHRKIQNMAKIPLLLAANTECGGDGLCQEGTSFGKPMAVAATGNPEHAYEMGYVACKEGAAAGMNWSFAPIVDIDYEFHNPITNVRTFGSDPKMVKACGSAYLRGAEENNVMTAIKHFPGDGCDERDQHLLTSVNSMECDEWDASYGDIYQALIDQGSKSVMVGHIAMPAYVEKFNPNASNEEKLQPATLRKELVTDLLRGKLGFNGLVSTDASLMLGFMAAMPRRKAIPQTIAAGCDMLLFCKDTDEDYQYMMDGIRSGVITEERLDDAVTRILAAKASLKLHEKQKAGTLVPEAERLSEIGAAQHKAWAKVVADESVTLVKDTQHLLPISTDKYKKVYLNVVQKDMDPENPVVQEWKALFEKEGFEVTVRDRTTKIDLENFAGINMTPEKEELMIEMYRPVEETKKSKDLYVYIANVENASNNTTTRLNWNVVFGLGDDAPWFVQEVPTLLISTANPYHMFDAPMVKTMVNAYSHNPVFNEAVMDKIMGRSEFKGKSPVDPCCGSKYLKMSIEKDS